MERIVIVAYKAKPGKFDQLVELVRDHYNVLNMEGLVTNRSPILMKGENEVIVELFEWKSESSIKEAHENDTIQTVWKEFEEVCEYVKPSEINEFNKLFSEFEAFE